MAVPAMPPATAPSKPPTTAPPTELVVAPPTDRAAGRAQAATDQGVPSLTPELLRPLRTGTSRMETTRPFSPR